MKRHYYLYSLPILTALFLLFAGFTSSETMPADEAEVGEMAPAFSLPDTEDNTHALADFEGKFVVLEWLNFGCPYVKRHYNSGNMPELQKEFTDKDVVWLSIVSSAPGKQGYYEAAQMNKENDKMGGMQTAILLDPSGDVGRLYGAKTTPHMYIINPEGKLIYKGGIDDQPRARESETKNATNFVSRGAQTSHEWRRSNCKHVKTLRLLS